MVMFFAIINIVLIVLIAVTMWKTKRDRYMHKVFRRFGTQVNIGYCRYDYTDGIILATNYGFIKMLDLDMKPGDVTGKTMSELIIYGGEEDEMRKLLEAKGEIRNYEYRFQTLNGQDKYVIYNAFIEKEPSSGSKVVEMIIDETTEEKLAYEEMKESQQRYKKLFENSGDMVIICDMENFIIEEANPVTEVVTGFPDEELVGKPFDDLLHPNHRKELEQSKKDLSFRGSARVETVLVCQNGTYKEVIMTLSEVNIKDRRVTIAVLKDVSTLVKAREEAKKRKEELESFCLASVKREERIKELRQELERIKQKIKLIK